MQGSFRIGTVAGIEVRVHYSWLLAFVFIAWSLAVGYFPSTNDTLSRRTDWVLGVIAALLLFASVLIHELGHSFVARSRGLRVENITLFIFGGMSSIETEPDNAKDEFLVAAAGTLVVSAAISLPIALVREPAFTQPSFASLAAVIWLGVGPTAFATICYYRLISSARSDIVIEPQSLAPLCAPCVLCGSNPFGCVSAHA